MTSITMNAGVTYRMQTPFGVTDINNASGATLVKTYIANILIRRGLAT